MAYVAREQVKSELPGISLSVLDSQTVVAAKKWGLPGAISITAGLRLLAES
jgi:hypothetical protein